MPSEATESKLTQVLFGLIDHSEVGRLRWEETAEENMFRTKLNSGMIRVGEDRDPIGKRHYTVWIMDQEGRIVEELVRGTGREP
jgi:hypothetical protein